MTQSSRLLITEALEIKEPKISHEKLPPKNFDLSRLHSNGNVYTEKQIEILEKTLIKNGHYSKKEIIEIFKLHKETPTYIYAVEKTARGLYFKTTAGGEGANQTKYLQHQTSEWYLEKSWNENNERGKDFIQYQYKNCHNFLLEVKKADKDCIERKSTKTGSTKHYVIMKREQGDDLFDVLEGGSPAWDVTFHRITCVATAVKEVHELGYIHRDIKLENFMFSYLYGATLVDPDEVLKVGYTQPQKTLIGTTHYLAPELVSAFYDHRPYPYSQSSDVYATGITFVELINIKRYDRKNNSSLTLRANKFKDLQELIYKMCDQEPSKRPTIQEVYKELDSFRTQYIKEAHIKRIQALQQQEDKKINITLLSIFKPKQQQKTVPTPATVKKHTL